MVILFGTLIDPHTDLLLLCTYYLYFLLFFQQSAHEKFFFMNFCAFWKTFINLTYFILAFPPTEYKEKQGRFREGKVINIGLFIL